MSSGSSIALADSTTHITTPDKSRVFRETDVTWIESEMDLNNSRCSSGARSPDSDAEKRRGRPRSDIVMSLIIQGSSSPSSIKCQYCTRVFPREKSLQAHLRTHTGEKPYVCDFPDCHRAFTQSGQLKTHQRLHAGEKPFVCSYSGCSVRFTHANRHCPAHPQAVLKRSNDVVLRAVGTNESNEGGRIQEWLEKYRKDREEACKTGKPRPKKRKISSSFSEQENISSLAGMSSDESNHQTSSYPSLKTSDSTAAKIKTISAAASVKDIQSIENEAPKNSPVKSQSYSCGQYHHSNTNIIPMGSSLQNNRTNTVQSNIYSPVHDQKVKPEKLKRRWLAAASAEQSEYTTLDNQEESLPSFNNQVNQELHSLRVKHLPGEENATGNERFQNRPSVLVMASNNWGYNENTFLKSEQLHSYYSSNYNNHSSAYYDSSYEPVSGFTHTSESRPHGLIPDPLNLSPR
ncbi:unnamed protein product [Allacma fusca]|uniref:C2H2-type domain-containing protein n=1 Tax=Allacma fusca TaxID=39272 RepID=A0A8J2PC14_9HEXA|nr:unnamed protein product [Allacma fusca]